MGTGLKAQGAAAPSKATEWASAAVPSYKQSRSKRQAARDRRALKILRDTGLYTGKVDLRKKPTSYQKRQMRRFADVIGGRAKVVTPAEPADYRGILPVRGDKVIVPRKKGERVKLDKRGEIIIEKKIGKRQIRRRLKKIEKIKPRKRPVRYGLPFNRGGGNIEIKWFPSRAALDEFMMEYEYKDYEKYVVEEEYDDFEDLDEELDFQE